MFQIYSNITSEDEFDRSFKIGFLKPNDLLIFGGKSEFNTTAKCHLVISNENFNDAGTIKLLFSDTLSLLTIGWNSTTSFIIDEGIIVQIIRENKVYNLYQGNLV
jgi:hypothetical protein